MTRTVECVWGFGSTHGRLPSGEGEQQGRAQVLEGVGGEEKRSDTMETQQPISRPLTVPASIINKLSSFPGRGF